MAIDTGHSAVVPTITVEDFDKLEPIQESPDSEEPIEIVAPGALPATTLPAIPDWYKVGWRAVGGVDEPGVTEGEVKDKVILDLFLKEQFYGEWYYNAGLIVVVCVILPAMCIELSF